MPFETGKKYTVSVIGGAGYAAGELIRLLLHHPHFVIKAVHSKSHSTRKLTDVHRDLAGETDLTFNDTIDTDADIIVFAQSHGEAVKLLETLEIPARTRIIDLSQDFRFASADRYNFIYGLPEANRPKISGAHHIANPGCFATAILLGLLPLAGENLLKQEIHISAITGSTGAGQAPSDTLHFSWRYSNISVYKAFEHQHLHEIRAQLGSMTTGEIPPVHFIPMRGNFTRGILAAMYTRIDRELSRIVESYRSFYSQSSFVHIIDSEPDIKMVVNTNKCFLRLSRHEEQLLIISVIDNLIKGAAGQALQNMNLMFGLPEESGLRLKAGVF